MVILQLKNGANYQDQPTTWGNKMKKTILLAVVVLLISFSNLSAQQSVGKVFDKQFADYAYGKVYFSFPLSEDAIKKILDDPTNYALFKVTKEKVQVFNADRKALYPADGVVGKDEPCYVYSKDKIKELLDSSKQAGSITVEMRGSHITLSSGEFTLEMTCFCPPICP